MADLNFNDNIRNLQTTDKNHADIFNVAPQKLLENTKYNKEQIEALRDELNETLSHFDNYLTTEQLSKLLETGIKGDAGASFQYEWNDTNLGVKTSEEENYTYVNLKGDKGDKGESGEVTLEQLEEAKSELKTEIANIPKVTKTSELTNDSNFITSSDIPTSLPASDVYAWAKSPTKPTYNAGEVGAIPTGASCNKNWNWAGQDGQPNWLWGGNDPTNMYVYNPSNFYVARSSIADRLGTLSASGSSHGTSFPIYAKHNVFGDNRFALKMDTHETRVDYATTAATLDGYTLEQIKNMCGGDIVGKDLSIIQPVKLTRGQTWSYQNSKGGMLELICHYNQIYHSLVVDGVTIYSYDSEIKKEPRAATAFMYFTDNDMYKAKIPFNKSVTITFLGNPDTGVANGSMSFQGVVYTNK